MNHKSKKKIYVFMLVGISLILIHGCKKETINNEKFIDHTGEKGSVTDIDGNEYKTIGIGSQIWMAENLKVTHYNDGTSIPEISDYNLWKSSTTGAYCSYNQDQGLSEDYGLLYNWYVVSGKKNIAPEGWHVPTQDEWDTLVNRLGGENIAGSKLKEQDNAHWTSSNADATNESGFSALPGGWRLNLGDYFYLNESGYWWTSSNDYLPGSFAHSYALYKDSTSITGLATIVNFGLSLRCIKDK